MARFRYFPGPRAGLLAGLALLVIATDIAFRVWVPPAEVPVAGDQTEKALSRLQPADPRLAPPFDPFYEEVATRTGQAEAKPGSVTSEEQIRKTAFDYRLLAISEVEGARLRAVIRMTRNAGKGDQPQRNIETLGVGDTIGDARVTSISEREVRLESESLGALALTLFLPPSAVPENGTVSAEL